MLRAIIRHIVRILRLTLTAPGRMLAELLPTGRQVPPPESVEELVDEQVADLRADLDTAPIAADAPLQTVGERIHEYASGDLQARGEFDLSGLPDDVAVALYVMSNGQLARLAAAGPESCARWAAGKKGLVGVPLPDAAVAGPADATPASFPEEAATGDRVIALA